jgi:hypothetical protein
MTGGGGRDGGRRAAATVAAGATRLSEAANASTRDSSETGGIVGDSVVEEAAAAAAGGPTCTWLPLNATPRAVDVGPRPSIALYTAWEYTGASLNTPCVGEGALASPGSGDSDDRVSRCGMATAPTKWLWLWLLWLVAEPAAEAGPEAEGASAEAL